MIEHIIPSSNISLDQVPGESFLLNCLQRHITFNINNKQIKKGKLLLFRRVHFYIQIALSTDKFDREHFEIPIPFDVENYSSEGLLYFDYRINSLKVSDLPLFPSKISSTFFNKILEISVER